MRTKFLSEVWCEWDIGQAGLVFADDHVAEKWLRNNNVLHEMAKADEMPFDDFYQDLVDNSLIGIEAVELVENV